MYSGDYVIVGRITWMLFLTNAQGSKRKSRIIYHNIMEQIRDINKYKTNFVRWSHPPFFVESPDIDKALATQLRITSGDAEVIVDLFSYSITVLTTQNYGRKGLLERKHYLRIHECRRN